MGTSGLTLAHSGGNFSAVHSGHGVVEDDGFDGVVVEDSEAGGTIERGEDFVAGALEDQLANLQARRLRHRRKERHVRLVARVAPRIRSCLA